MTGYSNVVSGEGAIDADTELPPPPVLCRLQAPRGLPRHFFAAFDTKILATHPRVTTYAPRMIWPRPIACDSFVPVLDIHDQGLVFGPRPKVADCVEDPLCIPVGDSLLALSSDSFQLLPPPPLAEPCVGEYCPWSWRALPKPPFESRHVTSYAVHPDGKTLFVGVETPPTPAAATFTAEMSSGSESVSASVDAEWKAAAHGVTLPGEAQRRPTVRLSKEKLFSEEGHMGATLVYLGGGSSFCLVQCLARQGSSLSENRRRYVLRLSVFSLKYDDKDGDLTTGESCHVRTFAMPEGVSEPTMKHPVAFWM
ncbi:hypothetical protein HU200_017522 [Digitaria exilis]|uniref:Uncharacterized protein n=1 Tax=Digitaria exilis TaxID=1010633 RepID=A0A835F669_9POAL|nr:hypothetical protein HU200_017522 [Digitaria exilis]